MEALDAAALVDILAETRLATRARAADPGELAAAAAALPSVFLPGSGDTAVDLTV